jgi:hypothetical protein
MDLRRSSGFFKIKNKIQRLNKRSIIFIIFNVKDALIFRRLNLRAHIEIY